MSEKSLYKGFPSPTNRKASLQGLETRGILSSFLAAFAGCWAVLHAIVNRLMVSTSATAANTLGLRIFIS
jgi:hypothetical protein